MQRQKRRGIRTGVSLATKHRRYEVGALRKMPTQRFEAYAGFFGDLSHRRIDAGRRKDLLRASVRAGCPGASVPTLGGSLAIDSDPKGPYRPIFGPVYLASKTALNALTVAMAIELEDTVSR